MTDGPRHDVGLPDGRDPTPQTVVSTLPSPEGWEILLALTHTRDETAVTLCITSGDVDYRLRVRTFEREKFVSKYVLELKQYADRERALRDCTTTGTSEQQSRLEHLVFEPVKETLTQWSGVTVFIGTGSDRIMRPLYYRWKRGVDAMEGSDGSD